MRKIPLPYTVMLDRQLDTLKGLLDVPYEVLRSIVHYQTSLHQTETGIWEPTAIYELDARNRMHFLYRDDGSYQYGADAIQILRQKKGVPFSPLTEILLPDELEAECSPQEWEDIEHLANQVEDRAAILAPFRNRKQVPYTILLMGRIMLWEAVEQLENNDVCSETCLRDAEGRVFRSLHDIGYSLIDGWDTEMRRQFAEEERKKENTHS